MHTKTINLRDVPEELVRRAKTYAAWRGLSLKDFILGAVRQALESAGPGMGAMSLFAQPGRKAKSKTRKRS
jgi:hypothetical protein